MDLFSSWNNTLTTIGNIVAPPFEDENLRENLRDEAVPFTDNSSLNSNNSLRDEEGPYVNNSPLNSDNSLQDETPLNGNNKLREQTMSDVDNSHLNSSKIGNYSLQQEDVKPKNENPNRVGLDEVGLTSSNLDKFENSSPDIVNLQHSDKLMTNCAPQNIVDSDKCEPDVVDAPKGVKERENITRLSPDTPILTAVIESYNSTNTAASDSVVELDVKEGGVDNVVAGRPSNPNPTLVDNSLDPAVAAHVTSQSPHTHTPPPSFKGSTNITANAVEIVTSNTTVNDVCSSESEELRVHLVVEELTNKLNSVTDENRQLHQVINQFRQTRRSTKENIEDAVSERNELRCTVESLQQEIVSLKGAAHNRQMVAESEYKQQMEANLTSCRKEIRALNAKEAQLSGALHQSNCLLQTSRDSSEVMTADMRLLQYDLQQREEEIGNLHQVMETLEKDVMLHRQRMLREYEVSCKEQCVAAEEKLQTSTCALQETITGLEKQITEHERLRQDEIILRRKMEVDLQKEKVKIQKALENAMSQMKNTSLENMVDRTILANFVVTYIQKNRPREVLQLLSKILNFTDDQNVAVGLKVAPSVNIVSSLFQRWNPNPHTEELDTEDSSKKAANIGELGELWVNFLIDETDQANQGKTFKPPKNSILSESSSVASSSFQDDDLAGEQAFAFVQPNNSPSPTFSSSIEINQKLQQDALRLYGAGTVNASTMQQDSPKFPVSFGTRVPDDSLSVESVGLLDDISISSTVSGSGINMGTSLMDSFDGSIDGE